VLNSVKFLLVLLLVSTVALSNIDVIPGYSGTTPYMAFLIADDDRTRPTLYDLATTFAAGTSPEFIIV